VELFLRELSSAQVEASFHYSQAQLLRDKIRDLLQHVWARGIDPHTLAGVIPQPAANAPSNNAYTHSGDHADGAGSNISGRGAMRAIMEDCADDANNNNSNTPNTHISSITQSTNAHTNVNTSANTSGYTDNKQLRKELQLQRARALKLIGVYDQFHRPINAFAHDDPGQSQSTLTDPAAMNIRPQSQSRAFSQSPTMEDEPPQAMSFREYASQQQALKQRQQPAIRKTDMSPPRRNANIYPNAAAANKHKLPIKHNTLNRPTIVNLNSNGSIVQSRPGVRQPGGYSNPSVPVAVPMSVHESRARNNKNTNANESTNVSNLNIFTEELRARRANDYVVSSPKQLVHRDITAALGMQNDKMPSPPKSPGIRNASNMFANNEVNVNNVASNSNANSGSAGSNDKKRIILG
jgi:hypothetical protein